MSSSNTELNEGIRKRGVVKGKLTRFGTFFNTFQRNEKRNYTELKLRLDKLETLFDEFDIIQTEIEAFAEPDSQQEERIKFENEFFSIQAAAVNELASHEPSDLIDSRNNRQGTDAQVKLPRINLPEFNGEYENWQSFRDNFTVIIHNTRIPTVQKLQYLRLSLKGIAAQLIESLEVTEGNYEVAWNLVQERFENKRLIVHTHVSKLFAVNKLERESALEMRSFFDAFMRHLGALKAIGEPVDEWSTLLVHIASSKLDDKSLMVWETSRIDTSVPTWKEFTTFLNHRCQTLAAVEVSKLQGRNMAQKQLVPVRRSFSTVQSRSTSSETKCSMCKLIHALYQCPKFLALRTPERVKFARTANVCVNCLRGGHRASSCRSAGCQKCNKRHNSKLHLEDEERAEAFANSVLIDEETGIDSEIHENIVDDEEVQTTFKAQITEERKIQGEVTMLSTALVIIADVRGRGIMARVLLDSGSQVNLMTTRLAMKLGWPITETSTTVIGVSGMSCKAIGQISANIKSRINAYSIALNFLVLQNIANTLPAVQPNAEILNTINPCECADPDFSSNRKIDMILGSEIFFELLCIGQIKPAGTRAIWQKTVFGWILSGRVQGEQINPKPTCMSTMVSSDNSIQNQVQKFWELEEVIEPKERRKYNAEESKCETHFLKTCSREPNGRFTLKLPFRDNIQQLGESCFMATKRFYQMERKLNDNSELKLEYVRFMREYQNLGHMTLSNDKNIHSKEHPQVFLPHHPIIRTESSTTKIRVVFDASAKTSSNISLNDTLMIGATIQDDLRGILMRFRIHQVVLTADIEKMYRQINVSENCQSYQQILWRENSSDPLETYRLNTVTYGTSSAPFMAIRTLFLLADCETHDFANAAHITKRDFYVDDLLTGATDILKAAQIQDDMLNLCNRGGFSLRKWCSNREELLNRIPDDLRATSSDFSFQDDHSTKTLGVRWKPKEDRLHYKVQVMEPLTRMTKRNIVSEISRLFDPLGLVGPVIVKAKIFIQQLWKLKVSWDESLPIEYHTAWERYRKELLNIGELNIPRRVILSSAVQFHELHIFCDASQAAYGACAYIRTSSQSGEIHSQLLIAKSRVSPLKTVTMPRLELCAALLGSKLMAVVVQSLKDILEFDRILLWSDSMIVLNWIRSEGATDTLKIFVANRVEEIRELTNKRDWWHVDGRDNPADFISRGLSVSELINCTQWWIGPSWMLKSETEWPEQKLLNEEDDPMEHRKVVKVLHLHNNGQKEFHDVIKQFSKLERLQRVTAYLFRAVTLAKNRFNGELKAEEVKQGLMYWVKITQSQAFATEITQLKTGTSLNDSKLQSLVPFIDKNDILRVGGRLQHSNEPYDARHPIILPSTAYLVELIADKEHRRLIHAGPQQVIASLQRTFWIPGLRNVIQKIIFKCNPCYRWKIQASKQLMGSLPVGRVNPSSVFHICGVDYAGPFQVRFGSRRSKHIYKSYVALFVCFATKAVHLEWVDDLTTESFLATLRIFIARRGCPLQIHSDNGRNFVGASAQLKNFFESKEFKQNINAYASQAGLEWSFIPPHSPHMGGLWEAGVKSMKFHLRRCLTEQILNHQEAKTVLAQVEAVLNSRPITAASRDPSDMEVLTPGHFIIGKPLTAFPEQNFSEVKSPRLRWHMVQQLVHGFWHRWRTEYLHSLQVRHKWSQTELNLNTGDLVLIREDHAPPLTWRRGRILILHEGTDGLVRVATIKTSQGEIKRPIHKLCLLPEQSDNKLNPLEV